MRSCRPNTDELVRLAPRCKNYAPTVATPRNLGEYEAANKFLCGMNKQYPTVRDAIQVCVVDLRSSLGCVPWLSSPSPHPQHTPFLSLFLALTCVFAAV